MVAPRSGGSLGVSSGTTTSSSYSSSGPKASSSSASKGSGTGPGGMFGSGTGGGGGGGSSSGNRSGPGGTGGSKTPSSSAKPGGAPKSSTSQAAKNPSAAPKASATPKPGGSGIIGSKGGGASVQKPGAGKGPAAAGKSSTLKAFTAGSNLAANRNQQMKGVGQGFISSKTQSLKDQYSQYRSPPGVQAPKAPTAGRGNVAPSAPPQNAGGILRSPGQAAPPKNFASPQRPSGPTVNAGTSWTNPNGVPANVAKALADRGFAPDGTRLPTQSLINRGPLDPGMQGRLEQANKN